MNATKSIETLQYLTTALSHGAFVHLVQGKHFESLGFGQLGEKYIGHYDEEMGWVKKFMSRINDLGGTVKIEAQPESVLVSDPLPSWRPTLRPTTCSRLTWPTRRKTSTGARSRCS